MHPRDYVYNAHLASSHSKLIDLTRTMIRRHASVYSAPIDNARLYS